MKSISKFLYSALIFSILISFNAFNAASQGLRSSISIAMEKCEFTSLPITYIPLKSVYSSSGYPISSNDISFVLYKDLQHTMPFSGEDGIAAPFLEAKIPFGDKNLCLFQAYGCEFDGHFLAIVDNLGRVFDQLLVCLYGGVIISRQFKIDEDGNIFVYSFIPDTTTPILIENCSLNLPTLNGKVCTEVYRVVNNTFARQSQEYGPSISWNLRQDKDNGILRNLWNL